MRRYLLLLSALFSTHLFSQEEKAYFAGGCFWCIEAAFDGYKGVKSAVSGYSDGEKANPAYKEVASGKTKHLEAVEVTFDSKKVTYRELVERFWRNIDPTDPGGQFADRGRHYTTAIFYTSGEQKKVAEESKKALQESKRFSKAIVTRISPFKNFYRAEEKHQDYHLKNPGRYKRYSVLSGRVPFLKKVWGKE